MMQAPGVATAALLNNDEAPSEAAAETFGS